MKFDKLYQKGVVRTHSGIYFDLLNPKAEDVFAIDIAIGLSRECRFAGGAKKFYSVAEHSIWCALRAEDLYPHVPLIAFKLLLHDAHEYIWKDLPSPIKHLFPDYVKYATNTQVVINERFSVYYTDADMNIIAEIDHMALEFEWECKVTSASGIHLQPELSASLFMEQFKRLSPVEIISPTKATIV